MKSRFLKLVKTSQTELDSHEQRVNAEIQKLSDAGAKIVSITHIPFGISPMYLLCHIIYEDKEPEKIDSESKI
ncbi:MAG: hypothetical protein V3G42_13200 [Oscillospiraceae bacterium]